MSLPHELLDIEILCRLPVKSLLRFRCVSREWCSLIDSPAFVKIHRKRTTECQTYGGVILTGVEQFYLADLESLHAADVHVKELEEPLKTLLSGAQFMGAVNGLICFCKNKRREFIIFNPSIRKYRIIPRMPREFARSFDLVKVSPCGFGYDHVNDDYKVVKIANLHGMMVMVYSLKMDYWTQIRKNFPSNISLKTKFGLYTSGTLNWLAKKARLVGFDLALEQFKEVPFPVDDGKFYLPEYGSFCILNDNIFRTDKWHFSTDAWLINNYGTDNTWYKAFSLERPGALGFFRFMKPVVFSRSGKEVLLQVDGARLVWYDLERKVVKDIRFHGIPIRFGSHLYTESLVQLTKDQQLQKPSEEKIKKKRPKKR